jgi:uncharacterized protein
MTEELSREEKITLLKIARDTVTARAYHRPLPLLPDPLPPALARSAGAFVTLHKLGQLRGCIGNFFAEGPLAAMVQNMAVAAGWEDPRFSPVSDSELAKLDIEISVLSPLREISEVKEIEVGKHGIFITKGYYRGVLLPQVATEYGWDRETFLAHTCQKAGLPMDAWKKGGLKIEIFSAEVFGEKELGLK